MAIKYTRESEDRPPERGFHTPFLRQGGTFELTPRRKFMMIYGGLAAFALCAVLLKVLGPDAALRTAGVQRAVGEVVEKEAREEEGVEKCYLRIRVPLKFRPAQVGEIALEREYWEGFSPGDAIAVLYEVDRDTGQLRLLECGLFALDPAAR
jgi:hypothetical protein